MELDEILGYHLERACTYRIDLGQPPDPKVAFAARERLKHAANRAGLRADYRAAMSLYQRAAALVPPTEVDYPLEIGLAGAQFWGGRPAKDSARGILVGTPLRSAIIWPSSQDASRPGRGFGHALRAGRRNRATDALVDEALPVFQAAGRPGPSALRTRRSGTPPTSARAMTTPRRHTTWPTPTPCKRVRQSKILVGEAP